MIACAFAFAALRVPAQATDVPGHPMTLDGATLGGQIGDYIAAHGQPTKQTEWMHHHQEQQDGKTAFIVSLDGSIDSWQLANGGRLVLTADGKGRIVIVHVRAGPKEIRDVPVLSGTARFNDGNHTNVLPPPPLTGRADLNNCGVVLHGSSCAGFAVSPNVELVMNFGGDNGTADWNLTDLVLGYVPPLLEVGFL
jgi:hypothetical protein